MENDGQRRPPRQHLRLSSIPNWKRTLIDNCNKRVKQNRARLLWKFRQLPIHNHSSSNPHQVEDVQAALKQIVSDELEKMRDVFGNDAPGENDDIWEYDGLHNAYQGECEEILLEMQNVFYQDLRPQLVDGGGSGLESFTDLWEDAEDEYLARATYEHMCLTKENEHSAVWCPICKAGVLKQDHQRIYCTLCELQLQRGEEVNLELLRDRLAEVHADHFDQGCKLSPKFSVDSQFGLTALYILCAQCNLFEIVM